MLSEWRGNCYSAVAPFSLYGRKECDPATTGSPKPEIDPQKNEKALLVSAVSVRIMAHLLGEIPSDQGGLQSMIRQTVLDFKMESTQEHLTAH